MPDETPDELHLDDIFLWNSIKFDQPQPNYYQLLEEKNALKKKTFISDSASSSSLLLLQNQKQGINYIWMVNPYGVHLILTNLARLPLQTDALNTETLKAWKTLRCRQRSCLDVCHLLVCERASSRLPILGDATHYRRDRASFIVFIIALLLVEVLFTCLPDEV